MSDQLQIPVSILPGVAFFIAAQLVVHIGYCLLTWFAASFTAYLFKLKSGNKFNLALGLWFIGIGAALAANQFYYPNSKFTELTSLFFINQSFAAIFAAILASVWLAASIMASIGLFLWICRQSFNYVYLFILLIAAIAGITQLLSHPGPPTYAKTSLPNIIIIGMDSLRPDFLGYFGAEQPTPFIDKLLEKSAVFSEAVTPLARTFPSWSSILLGQHPRQSGIRYNLAKTENIDLSHTIPAIFQQHGYHTIYATDETRFSNIDKRFGFNQAITPPMGLNDFLLGTFNDFPLSNLLVNTALGRWLFPYSYANRPAFATYDPDSFIALIRPALLQSRQQPLLMAVHLCLPHHPYLWASLKGSEYTAQERYRASVARVDQQLKSLFNLLQQAQLLDNTIVVLLSDHGEALELSGDRITQPENYLGKLNKAGQPPRFYPPSLDDETVNQSAGHGTDVLGLPQYHTLLAFKLYGRGEQRTGEIAGVVPLTDIKQALVSLAGIDAANPPLARIVRGDSVRMSSRHIFMESDYSPESIHTVYPETRKVLLEGIQLFQVDPLSARLTVKDKMGDMIIHSKQYADIYENWMLALYPQNSGKYIPILINLQTGKWTNNLQANFALKSPANKMLAAMKHFYGNELK